MSTSSPNQPSPVPAWHGHLRPTLEELSVYDAPPITAAARMHANECPYPWPAQVMQELGRIVTNLELGRYPDTSGRELRRVLAEQHGCSADRIVLGNGSDEVIFLILTALSGGRSPGALVTPAPTFVMYRHTARVLGMPVREVDIDDAFGLREDAMRAALPGAAACFLARPNNPTGALWDREVISRLIADHPQTIFVVDEAYCDYAPGQSMWRADGPSNYVHMSTLSKVGLAGLRLGYCIADPQLALALNKVRHPYNISQTTLALCEAVLTRFQDTQAEMVARTIQNRTRLAQMLERLPGATVYPSAANLVLVRLRSDGDAPSLRAHLAAHDVLIKDVSKTPRLERCVRISVGTEDELARIDAALRDWSPSS